MSKIDTLPIGQLIRNEQTPPREEHVETYIIPDYQRGYRWGEFQITSLLNDLDTFIKSHPNSQESYCLQPIVVTRSTDSRGVPAWEVIDGQQRLITLYILLSELQKPHYHIEFKQRPKSTAFLQSLARGTRSSQEPDFHFMSQACGQIQEWVKNHTTSDIGYKDRLGLCLIDRVRVIWYEVECATETEKIDIFNRLNIGKIPLTDTELIKALLFSKIKANLPPRELHLRQAEMANEWYGMETALKNEALWRFIHPDDDNGTDENRLGYLFELIAKQKNRQKWSPKNYGLYQQYELRIRQAQEQSPSPTTEQERESEADEVWQIWDELKQLFAKITGWYDNRTLYHLVGFLLASRFCSLEELCFNYSDLGRQKFEEQLRQLICDGFQGIHLSTIQYGDSKLKALFLLFNVLSMEQLTDIPQNRFPFHYYNSKPGQWSIEHIHAQHAQDPFRRPDAALAWIEETTRALEHLTDRDLPPHTETDVPQSTLEEVKTRLKQLKQQDKSLDLKTFNQLRDEITRLFDSKSVHELDNLALLATSNNATLNNAIFPVKRDGIKEMEQRGEYIPACTRNVFFKFYSASDHQPYYWGEEDKKAYVKAMKDILKPYIAE